MAATELMLNAGSLQNLDNITNRCVEAKFHYNKAKNPKLAVECQYRMAKLYINSKLRTKGIELMSRVLDTEMEGIDQYDKIYVAEFMGALCRSIGYERKAGFFFKLAAHKCYDTRNLKEALAMMDVAAETYHIKGCDEEARTQMKADSSFNIELYNQRENIKPWVRGQYKGWKNLQKNTLEYLKSLSKHLGDATSSVKYT